MVEREQRDRSAQPDRAGARGERGQKHRRGRHQAAVGVEVVLVDPGAGKTQLLAVDHQLEQVLVVLADTVPRVGIVARQDEHSEAHCGYSSGRMMLCRIWQAVAAASRRGGAWIPFE